MFWIGKNVLMMIRNDFISLIWQVKGEKWEIEGRESFGYVVNGVHSKRVSEEEEETLETVLYRTKMANRFM